MGILLVFGSSEGKAKNPPSKSSLDVWDTRRGHWKGKAAPTAPPVLWHLQVWGGEEIPLQVSSQCKNFGNNLTAPSENRTSSSLRQHKRTNTNREMLQHFAVKKSLCCCSATGALQIHSALPEILMFYPFSHLFLTPSEGRKKFEGSLKRSFKEATQAPTWGSCSWTKPKRFLLQANPKAERILTTNSGLRWSFAKLCGWKSSTRALLSCSSTVCSWRKRQKINEDAAGRMCTPIFYRSMYKYMVSSFEWSFIKPDSSFSRLQHAIISNSDIKVAAKCSQPKAVFKASGREKLNLVHHVNYGN